MSARLARPSDADALEAFDCAGLSRPHYETEVEEWVRHSWRWFAESSSSGDRRLIVLEDDESGTLAAVGAHCLDGAEWRRFIPAVAVALDFQDRRGLGIDMLSTVIVDAEAHSPGGRVSWKVDPDNRRSIGLSEQFTKDWTELDEDAPYLRFRMDLRGVGPRYP